MPASERETKIRQAARKIEEAIAQNGAYSHNIIGLVLSQLAAEVDYAAANQLVDEFYLTALYGIYKVEKD